MNERVAITALSLALTAVVSGVVIHALHALAAVTDLTTSLGTLPSP